MKRMRLFLLCAALLASQFAAAVYDTSWEIDFSTQTFPNYFAAPNWMRGFVSCTTDDINTTDTELELDYVADPDGLDYWKPTIQHGWDMNLDPSKDYIIEITLEITATGTDTVPVAFTWNDSNGDLCDWCPDETIEFDVPANSGEYTIKLYTNDTDAYPAFAKFGKDAGDTSMIGGFRLEFGIQGQVDESDFASGACHIDKISFTEDTGSEKAVFATYFPGGSLREISNSANNWYLYGDSTGDGQQDVAWSGDIYYTADKKECSNTFYPWVGFYDTVEEDTAEYMVLLARVCGVDGMLTEVAQRTNHADKAMDKAKYVAETRGYDVTAGLHVCPASWFPNHENYDSWADRDAAIENACSDMLNWLEDVYDDYTGARWKSRPVLASFRHHAPGRHRQGLDRPRPALLRCPERCKRHRTTRAP